MAEHGGHHGPSWYKVFATGLAVTYLFFLFMIAQCTFSLADPLSLFNTFLCVLYIGFAFLCFIIALPVCLVGVEHARKQGRPRGYYYFLVLYFLAGALGIIAYRFM